MKPFASRTVSCAASALGPGVALGLTLGEGEGEGEPVRVGGAVPGPLPLGGALEAVGPTSTGSPVSRCANHTAVAPIASAATATSAVVGVSHRARHPSGRAGSGATGGPGCAYGSWTGPDGGGDEGPYEGCGTTGSWPGGAGAGA
ncbi:hypothetical protein ABZY44_10485 [Streptomyces sp. NPDC006544]|uniref:hypothetical protein n=1 Tax=Streptomyces sp. NPDC006544 TaxID=3154583 RepID=UPI0033B70442